LEYSKHLNFISFEANLKNVLNAKCDCGSGRKARYCCKKGDAKQKANELLVRQVRAIPKKMASTIVRFLPEYLETYQMEDAWVDFTLDSREGIEEAFMQVFTPWVFYSWDMNESKSFVPAQKYLQKNKAKLSEIEFEYIKHLVDTPLSFFKVLDISSDGMLVVSDLLQTEGGGPEISFYDKAMSESLSIGVIFFGLVGNFRGVGTVEGVAPFVIPPKFLPEIEELRESIATALDEFSSLTLKDFEYEILDDFWAIFEVMTRRPKLQNTSGEELCFHRMIFDCEDGREAIVALADLCRNKLWTKDILEKVESGEHLRGPLRFVWCSAKVNKKLGGPTTYGDLEVQGNLLTVLVNSTQRAERFKKEIEKRLGSKVKLRLDEIESPDFSENDSPDPSEGKSSGPQKLSDMSPEMQLSFKNMAESRKKEWYDYKIPLLGNLTPREAAKTTDGRKKLEMLIEEYNYNWSGGASDVAAMMNPTEEEIRRELGI